MDIEYNIFYQKKKELIFFSKKYEFELNENLETITFGKNTIICQFTVKYNDKIQFQFNLKCEANPEKCFAVKNKKKIDITYDTVFTTLFDKFWIFIIGTNIMFITNNNIKLYK